MSVERILTEHADALSALTALNDGLSESLLHVTGIEAVEPSELPDTYRRLLVHTRHMTPTLKAYFGREVSLHVLAQRNGDRWYRRAITLAVEPDGRPVEFGIVRIDVTTLPDDVRAAVLERRRPLGDILIDHGVMTRVEPQAYLRFGVDHAVTRCLIADTIEEEVSGAVGDAPVGKAHPTSAAYGSGDCYGRLATIYCNGRPAIELLEVVTDDGRGRDRAVEHA